jgi:GTP cyclohydrolase II
MTEMANKSKNGTTHPHGHYEAALEAPVCLIRANERFAEGWVVARAPLSEAAAALLASGEGPVALVLPITKWRTLGAPMKHITLELAPMTAEDRQSLSPEGISEGLAAVLYRGGAAEPPPWLRCVSTRPGGIMAHWTPVAAAHELVQREGAADSAAVLRRIGLPPGPEDARVRIQAWAQARDLPMVDLFAFSEQLRSRSEPRLITLPVTARLPTSHGTFTVQIFEDPWTGDQHVALTMGDLQDEGGVLVRIHSECFTGDIMGSLRCDCGPQLDAALARVALDGRGVVLYLRQEGRGIGLYEKLRAYVEQDAGLDTVDANQVLGFPPDLRSYLEAADMLRALGVRRVRLLTNNPTKMEQLARWGVEVVDREPLVIASNPENEGYLETKRRRMGHLFQPPRRAIS